MISSTIIVLLTILACVTWSEFKEKGSSDSISAIYVNIINPMGYSEYINVIDNQITEFSYNKIQIAIAEVLKKEKFSALTESGRSILISRAEALRFLDAMREAHHKSFKHQDDNMTMTRIAA